MANREMYPPNDFDLHRKHGDKETWEQSQQYEVAYQLARIADALVGIREQLPNAGKGF